MTRPKKERKKDNKHLRTQEKQPNSQISEPRRKKRKRKDKKGDIQRHEVDAEEGRSFCLVQRAGGDGGGGTFRYGTIWYGMMSVGVGVVYTYTSIHCDGNDDVVDGNDDDDDGGGG